MFGFIKDKASQVALDTLKDKIINPQLEGIGKVTSIGLDGKHINLEVVLEDLETTPITIVCQTVRIADDGASILMGNFRSNKKFAENALNRFASKTYPVPDKPMLRPALVAVKKVMGI